MHFCGQMSPTATCGCAYHSRIRPETRGRVPEAERLARIKEITGADSKTGLIRIDTLDMGSFADRTGPGELALVRFLQMLDHIQFNSPEKSMHFPVNSDILKRLVVNHLGVIVGEGVAAAHSEQLIGIVTKKKLKSQSLCWITNRQQGKTTTISKFLAALLLMSPGTFRDRPCAGHPHSRARRSRRQPRVHLQHLARPRPGSAPRVQSDYRLGADRPAELGAHVPEGPRQRTPRLHLQQPRSQHRRREAEARRKLSWGCRTLRLCRRGRVRGAGVVDTVPRANI